ncbi:hypothetical protein QCA50_004405 [Cerrena zonata]|uniref:DUF1168-domain-containing protein n=1 Tax=Cerrena zonata TaxID=2478898 RepID=A0AAW0GS44_9APHY
MSASPSPGPSAPATRHAQTAVERQRAQLDKLLKDPAKPAYVPIPPKEKTIRPPREMMKNVQGSSAGAGSGEFHVYKASRRREYERLKLMEEESQKEVETAEFEKKKRDWEEQAEAKTAKNRAKRQKKKAKKGGDKPTEGGSSTGAAPSNAPFKKRRLVNGQELVFKKPGEDSDDEDVGPTPSSNLHDSHSGAPDTIESDQLPAVPVVEAQRIIIHEDD